MVFMTRHVVITCFALLLLVPGCARLVVPDMPAQKTDTARFQLMRLEGQNKMLVPYKGVGTLRFFSDQDVWSFRGAWLGVPDQRLRIESIGIAGQPSIRLICDRNACHFIYPENGSLRKISSRDRNLRRLAGIDMDVTDLLLLLGGGVPLASHDTAWMEDGPTGPVMILNRRFYGNVQKIYFTPDMSRVRMIEMFGFRALKYRAEIPSVSVVNGYLVPDILWVEDEAAALELRIERSWFDVTYSPESFIPSLPKNNMHD